MLRKRRIATGLLVVFATVITLLFIGQALMANIVKKQIIKTAQEYSLNIFAADVGVTLVGLNPKLFFKKLSVGAKGQKEVLEQTDVLITARWFDILDGNMVIDTLDLQGARINLLVDERGFSNWQQLKDEILLDSDPLDNALIIRRVRMEDATAEYINDATDQHGLVDIVGDMVMNDSALVTALSLTGEINLLPIELDAKVSFAEMRGTVPDNVVVDVRSSIDQITLNVLGQIDRRRPENAKGIDISFEGESIGETLSHAGFLNTGISSAHLDGSVSWQADDMLEARFNATLDNSAASGTIQLNGFADGTLNVARQVAGEVQVDRWYVDEFLAEKTSDTVQSETPKPDKSPAEIRLPKNTTVKLDIDVDQLISGRLRVNELKATSVIDSTAINISVSSNDFGKGVLESSFRLQKSDTGLQGKSVVKLTRIPLDVVMALLDVPEGAATGTFSGAATLWFDGKSVGEFVNSLDGGLYAVLENAHIDSLLVEMASIDFMESMNLVADKQFQQTRVRCGFVDIQLSKGWLKIKDFIIDTDDSLFLASGSIDLPEKKLNLKFSPHPRDTSFFAATTAFYLTGTFQKPKLRPGRKLYTRLALAAALAAIAGPAAIVLPFVEVGDGGKRSYCSELFGR